MSGNFFKVVALTRSRVRPRQQRQNLNPISGQRLIQIREAVNTFVAQNSGNDLQGIDLYDLAARLYNFANSEDQDRSLVGRGNPHQKAMKERLAPRERASREHKLLYGYYKRRLDANGSPKSTDVEVFLWNQAVRSRAISGLSAVQSVGLLIFNIAALALQLGYHDTDEGRELLVHVGFEVASVFFAGFCYSTIAVQQVARLLDPTTNEEKIERIIMQEIPPHLEQDIQKLKQIRKHLISIKLATHSEQMSQAQASEMRAFGNKKIYDLVTHSQHNQILRIQSIIALASLCLAAVFFVIDSIGATSSTYRQIERDTNISLPIFGLLVATGSFFVFCKYRGDISSVEHDYSELAARGLHDGSSAASRLHGPPRIPAAGSFSERGLSAGAAAAARFDATEVSPGQAGYMLLKDDDTNV